MAEESPDCATPPKPTGGPYWSVLIGAWIVSIPAVNILDHVLKQALYGGSADGGATILAMLAILPALVAASFLKRRSWVPAIVGGLCSPVAITLLYVL